MEAIVSAVPVWGLLLLGGLIVVQITLDVIALLDLYRRPVEQVLFANKWVWVAVVLLVSMLGAIIYLLAARKPAVLSENAVGSLSRSVGTDKVADTLYGTDGTDGTDGSDGTDQR
jgi:hypothetical protein